MLEIYERVKEVFPDNYLQTNKEYIFKISEKTSNSDIPVDVIKIGRSETNSKTITLCKHFSHDTILTFKHKYKDTFEYRNELINDEIELCTNNLYYKITKFLYLRISIVKTLQNFN